MKFIIIIIILILVTGCQLNDPFKAGSKNVANNRRLGTYLINNGFLAYADSQRMDSLKVLVRDSFDIYEEALNKICAIDAEELGKFDFDFFLPNLNKILAKRGFILRARKLNNNDESFDAIINADTVQLFTKEDLDNYSFWETASRNFFKKVNALLMADHIKEQFYLLYGGNDLNVFLLTEVQFKTIVEYYKDNPKESPYVP